MSTDQVQQKNRGRTTDMKSAGPDCLVEPRRYTDRHEVGLWFQAGSVVGLLLLAAVTFVLGLVLLVVFKSEVSPCLPSCLMAKALVQKDVSHIWYKHRNSASRSLLSSTAPTAATPAREVGPGEDTHGRPEDHKHHFCTLLTSTSPLRTILASSHCGSGARFNIQRCVQSLGGVLQVSLGRGFGRRWGAPYGCHAYAAPVHGELKFGELKSG
ncbi:hypothetical protein DFH09DRAFT_1274420 [Mycena vulgaris]|nr:hypothetical protein DFH09DRAFT_1274420 [Mycena vulgaris]